MSKNNKTGKKNTEGAAQKKQAGTGPGNNGMYKALWFAILVLLIVLFAMEMKKTPVADQKGKPTKMSFATLFDGSYQEYYENDLLKKKFMADLKKSKNEYEYDWFGKVNLDEAYPGKENFVFGESMTRAYFGDDFIGADAVKKEVEKAKFVQDKLKEQGVQLLILFAPGKNSIYPEFMPDAIAATEKKTTNSATFIKDCQALQVNCIDFISYFRQLKKTDKYPLFSKYGTHWSYYAECIAVDTTIKKLEQLMGKNLPNIRYSDIELKDTALVRDGDIFRKAGLPIPKGDKLAYPQQIGYDQGPGVEPQKIIGIGDSYFRCFLYLGALKNAFADSKQWYYYNSIIPESPDNPEVWELDLKAEVLKTKAVVLMCNEMNLQNLGNGFIDDAYELFKNPDAYYAAKKKKDALNKYKKQIRSTPALLAKVTKEANKAGVPLDSVMVKTAKQMQAEDKKGK